MSTCVALVLAAGRGKRFGSDKRLAQLPSGQTVLVATVERALTCFDQVHVVLRNDDEPRQLGLDSRVALIRAEYADEGMGASLAAGIGALADNPAVAVAVLLGDMPWIEPRTLRQLCAQADSERILMPLHHGQRGHPVLFGRRFWPALLSANGDQGGRQVIADNPQACVRIEVDDRGVVRDIDLPGDLVG